MSEEQTEYYPTPYEVLTLQEAAELDTTPPYGFRLDHFQRTARSIWERAGLPAPTRPLELVFQMKGLSFLREQSGSKSRMEIDVVRIELAKLDLKPGDAVLFRHPPTWSSNRVREFNAAAATSLKALATGMGVDNVRGLMVSQEVDVSILKAGDPAPVGAVKLGEAS